MEGITVARFLRRAQFRFWRMAEPRAIFEWQSFYLMKPLLRELPRGDGHAVIVFPGFMASDRSTAPMRKLLDELGYQAHGWNAGRNVTLDQALEKHLFKLLDRVHKETGKKVSLVGWSLGGLYARELAKVASEKVRCVITLGSPISGRSEDSNASRLFESIHGSSRRPKGHGDSLNRPPPVPTTSIYSRTDGIVHWKGSVQKQHAFPAQQQTENIELPASHLGLGVNVLAMLAIADRLIQPEGEWTKFSTHGWRAILFRKPQQRWRDRLRAATSWPS